MDKGIFPTDIHEQMCRNHGVLKATVNTVQIEEYEMKKLTISDRCVDFFKECAKEGHNYKPLAMIVSYILTIPGTYLSI